MMTTCWILPLRPAVVLQRRLSLRPRRRLERKRGSTSAPLVKPLLPLHAESTSASAVDYERPARELGCNACSSPLYSMECSYSVSGGPQIGRLVQEIFLAEYRRNRFELPRRLIEVETILLGRRRPRVAGREPPEAELILDEPQDAAVLVVRRARRSPSWHTAK